MDIQQYFDFCHGLKGTTEHFPFDNDTLVFKVGGKMYALSSLSQWESGNPAINLKGEAGWNAELRAEYEGIKPGWHMDKNHWNTVAVNADVPDGIVRGLIRDSHARVIAGLPKKVREEFEK
jgi:predicted DNA-binding protein (MmcQ/YjbR family)